MINPYANINWGTILRVHSLVHTHFSQVAVPQTAFDALYNAGIRHFAGSQHVSDNAHADAVVTYPLSSLIGTVPEDALGTPNIEEIYLTDILNCHICSVDGLYTPPVGGDTWRNTITNALANPHYKAGFIINHPNWTSGIITLDTLNKILNGSSRVLGIEIYNSDCEVASAGSGWAKVKWDTILSRGKKCIGTMSPDWLYPGDAKGTTTVPRNVLLVSSATENNCVDAYHNATFYGSLLGTSLAFTNISVANRVLTVSTNSATSISIIANGRTVKTISGASGTYTLRGNEVYLRIEATDGTDTIYSQPIYNERYKLLKRVTDPII